MGKMLLFLVFGAIIVFGTFATSMNEKMGFSVDNAVTHFERATTRNMNLSVLELALRELHNDITWREGFYDLDLEGGTTTLTLQDSVVGGDSVVVVYCTSIFGQDTATSIVVVKPNINHVPAVVRGAITAFGPIDKLVSDMILDGRNHDVNGVLIPGSGTYGVSTGEATFSNDGPAQIGGTDYTVPVGDIAPAIPEDPLTVEVNAPWPDGWPTTPDEAFELPEGTLKEIALGGYGGSRYVTTYADLVSAPIQGVTYVEVPPGTEWGSKYITVPNPKGIFVFHSSDTDARWWRIKISDGSPFEGVMIFDYVFHFHMDILGALIHLSPNTETVKDCHQNQDHWMNYSEDTIVDALDGVAIGGSEGSWAESFEIISWWE